MESEVQKWLRERYRPAPSDGPQAKNMKFGDVHHDLSTRFTPTSFNAKMVSQEIKTAFPNTYSKAVGSGRIKHVFGIERVAPSDLPSTSGHVEALEQRVRQLEERVRELEQPSQLSLEMNNLLTPNISLYHGPNTIENFEAFSIDSLVSELSKFAPHLYELFQTLGQTARHTNDNQAESDDVMAVMSLCTLLKCRSQKVLGVQLLITLMLLARSTNKQVR